MTMDLLYVLSVSCIGVVAGQGNVNPQASSFYPLSRETGESDITCSTANISIPGSITWADGPGGRPEHALLLPSETVHVANYHKDTDAQFIKMDSPWSFFAYVNDIENGINFDFAAFTLKVTSLVQDDEAYVCLSVYKDYEHCRTVTEYSTHQWVHVGLSFEPGLQDTLRLWFNGEAIQEIAKYQPELQVACTVGVHGPGEKLACLNMFTTSQIQVTALMDECLQASWTKSSSWPACISTSTSTLAIKDTCGLAASASLAGGIIALIVVSVLVAIIICIIIAKMAYTKSQESKEEKKYLDGNSAVYYKSDKKKKKKRPRNSSSARKKKRPSSKSEMNSSFASGKETPATLDCSKLSEQMCHKGDTSLPQMAAPAYPAPSIRDTPTPQSPEPVYYSASIASSGMPDPNISFQGHWNAKSPSQPIYAIPDVVVFRESPQPATPDYASPNFGPITMPAKQNPVRPVYAQPPSPLYAEPNRAPYSQPVNMSTRTTPSPQVPQVAHTPLGHQMHTRSPRGPQIGASSSHGPQMGIINRQGPQMDTPSPLGPQQGNNQTPIYSVPSRATPSPQGRMQGYNVPNMDPNPHSPVNITDAKPPFHPNSSAEGNPDIRKPEPSYRRRGGYRRQRSLNSSHSPSDRSLDEGYSMINLHPNQEPIPTDYGSSSRA